jgi:hypothetical protein
VTGPLKLITFVSTALGTPYDYEPIVVTEIAANTTADKIYLRCRAVGTRIIWQFIPHTQSQAAKVKADCK